MASLIYLASPFSNTNPAVREHRYLAARRFTIHALREGYAVFSPIVYGKDMEREIGTAFEPWQALNDAMIRRAEMFWVLRLDGWEESRGVTHEIALARTLKKTLVYVDPIEV
jgi:hypothetical protein